MAILVFASHLEGQPSLSMARLLGAAAKFGGPVDIIVAGSRVGSVAEDAARYADVRTVLVADSDALEHQPAQLVAPLLAELGGQYDVILAAADAVGKDILPRAAALLDTQPLSDVVAIMDENRFLRPIYAGNALETVSSLDKKKIMTIRLTSFEPVARGGTAQIRALDFDGHDDRVSFIEFSSVDSSRPDLTSARIVVAGGRGLGSKEQFEALIGPLADKLNAAVGASRAAVDSGYAPNDCQVGQTGKVVAPELYFACGISGATQHLAGMKESKVIVAINSDPDAPIFQFADYGLVGDVSQILPALTAKL